MKGVAFRALAVASYSLWWFGLIVLLGGGFAYADTPVGVDAGITYSNPTGQISGGQVTLDDANLHDTPGANRERLRENHVNLTPDPTCANDGADGKFTWIDANESSSANSWSECYELKTGTTVYTGADGSILARAWYDKDGNVAEIDLWPSGTGTDQASTGTVGTIAWAEATIEAGGLIYLNPGTYRVATADSLTFNQAGVTLQGASREGTKIDVPTSFNGDVIRIGFTGAQVKNVTLRDLEIDGNKANATTSVLVHGRDAKFSVLNANLHDAKTGGILIDATVSGIIKPRILDSTLFNFTNGAYGIKTSDDQGQCITDVVIQRNELGAAPIVVDECANGLQLEGNHIYGYSTDQSCVQITAAASRYDWRIANNTIESCGRHGVTISGGGADRGQITNNTLYCNSKTTDITYDAINLSGVDATLVADNIIRACATTAGMTRHGIYAATANNNRILGNMMIGTDSGSYAVDIVSGSAGTNTVALNQCSGTCAGNVLDTVTSDNLFNPNATYGWLMQDGFAVLPDGTNGVSINSSGVLAKVGTGSVQADDVVCGSGCIADAELASNYSGVGACTNQVVTTLNDNAAPTCSTVDISAMTNLGATSPLVMSGDSVTCPTCNVSSADITDVWGCTSGNCNALTGASGDTLDAGSADSAKPCKRGTLAARPATCAEGDCYHATDGGGTDTFICTATDTWTELQSALLTGNLTASAPLAFDATRQVIGGAAAISCATASGAQAGCLSSTDWTTFNNKQATLANYVATITAGAGLTGDASGAGSTPTLATASDEADFVKSGALTCGASTQGKLKVHTTPLQYCDNAATPALQYAAYGNSSGVATSALAANLWGATDSSNDAGSTGQVCRATGANACTWGALGYSDLSGAPTIAFTAAGTSGTPQTISNGDTLTIAAGSGITTTAGATDTVTIAAVDTSATNELNTFTAGTGGTTAGLAITLAGGGIVSTARSGDTVTITGTEVDGSATNEINTITADTGGATSGLAITLTGGAGITTTRAGDTVTIDAALTTADLPSGATLDTEWAGNLMLLTSTQTADWSGATIELPNATATTGTDCDAAGEAGRIFVDTNEPAGSKVKVCGGLGGWENVDSGTASSVAFSGITSGTNTTATMTVGSGGALVATAGTLRLPNSATAMSTCTVGDVKQDTDAAAGARLLICLAPDTPVAIDNPFGSLIDASELANSLTFTSSQALDLNTNDAALRLANTTSDPANDGSLVVDTASNELEWYSGGGLRGLSNYVLQAGRSGGQSLFGYTSAGGANVAFDISPKAAADGSDNAIVRMNGGGANGPTRGASVQASGNEYVSGVFAGVVFLDGGDVSGSSLNGFVRVRTGSSLATRLAAEYDGSVCLHADSCSYDLGIGGNAARTLAMERHTTANTAGNALTISAGGATSGATDKNGGALVLAPGTPTGQGKGYAILQTPTRATATGTSDQAMVDRVILGGKRTLTDASATAVVSATIASGSMAAGIIHYAIESTNGTDYQTETGQVHYAAVNKAGTVTANVTETAATTQAVSTGTLTSAWTISAASPTVISVSADTSLTPSSGYPRITFWVENLTDQAVALQ